MRAPYRIAVWGPGVMGQCAIRELVRLPETELVGVLAYSEAKNGVDVGTLAGVDPIGLTATTDAQAIIALKPDCVIHTARDFGDYRSDNDIVMLLEAGINVITVLSYQYPRARGKDVEQRFIDAGERGGATLHGNGVDPGFMYERLAALMTGVSNDIQYIRLEEYFNVSSVGAERPYRNNRDVSRPGRCVTRSMACETLSSRRVGTPAHERRLSDATQPLPRRGLLIRRVDLTTGTARRHTAKEYLCLAVSRQLAGAG
jgi:hypothetical protein